jgi:hypothetical protein
MSQMIPAQVAEKLPSMVRNELARLSAQKQEEFLEEFNRKAKDSGTAYGLWFLLGWHYIYLRKWGLQILFWLTFGGFLMWWFIDLFRVAGMVTDYNKDVATDVMRNLVAVSVSSSPIIPPRG